MAFMQEVKRRLTAVKGVRRRSRAQQKMAYLDVRKGLQIWQFVSSTDHFAGRSAKMAAEKPAKHRNRGPDDALRTIDAPTAGEQNRQACH